MLQYAHEHFVTCPHNFCYVLFGHAVKMDPAHHTHGRVQPLRQRLREFVANDIVAMCWQQYFFKPGRPRPSR